MKQLLKLAPWLIATGIAWGSGYFYNVRYGGELSWLRMMYEDKIAIASQIEAPRRLLITGGSGAHYTINAQLMEQELGFPVVNLGIDGPVGINVILPSILGQVRQGDIVLLVPEYLLLLDEDGFGDRSARFGVAIGKPGLGGVPPKQLVQDTILLGVPTLRGITKSTMDLVEKGKLTGYYSDPVDSRGDPTATKIRQARWWKRTFHQPVSAHVKRRIAQFRQEVEAKGGTLILSLPWVYANRDDPKTVKNVKITAKELAEIAPLIYDRESFNLKTDSSLFADTHYHLLPESRKLRSQELVRQLKPLIDQNTELENE